MKKHTLFINVFSTIRWVKPALPAEPILLTSTLLMKGPAEQRRRSRLVFYLYNIFCLSMLITLELLMMSDKDEIDFI